MKKNKFMTKTKRPDMVGNKWGVGRLKTEKERMESRNRFIGKNNPNWNGGATSFIKQIKNCFKFRQWKLGVLKKDNKICQHCGSIKNLETHHIKEFLTILKENKIETLEQALNCEELWDLNNGLTLCKECHNKTKKGNPNLST